MGILQADKFSPCLFLGLGGSGARIVEAMARKLTTHPNWARLRDLCHFVAIDTNKHDLDKLSAIPVANRYLTSAFDRQSYVARKRGRQELPEDPLVTQWVHDWYAFRSSQGAGAGQIRIESRLGLYYSLENDRAGIRKSLDRLLEQATRPNNPFRDNEDRVVNLFVYCSLAGGTGSGAFLPIAYLLQDLVRDQGWGRPNVVGNLVLPSVFGRDVEKVLQPDLNANAYAALKELEHLMRLGYEGLAENEPLHYDPTHPERDRVDRRPFSIAYLLDKPAELSLERYTAAIADSSFLQIFSPVLGAQVGEYDNYDKHQKSLALGHFTVHYGTFGSSVLIFPREDVLEYASMRYAAKVLGTYLSFGNDPIFRVPWEDERFQRLAPREQDTIVDDKYRGWVQHRAKLEKDENLRGVFTDIVEQRSPEGTSLAELFQRKLADVYQGLDGLVQIEPFDDTQINEQRTSLTKPIDDLRRDIQTSRSRVMDDRLKVVLAEIQSDRFLGDFFTQHRVDPLKQRLFLIELGRAGAALGPFEAADENESLLEKRANPSDLDVEHFVKDVKDHERRLARAADSGVLGKLRKENKAFNDAKRTARNFLDAATEDNRDFLKRSFWIEFHQKLSEAIEARLKSFRDLSKISNDLVEGLRKEATRFLEDPGAVSDRAAAAQYYLDLEALRDDRRGARLWDRFFEHRLDRTENYDEDAIFGLITTAFRPAERNGRLYRKDPREIADEVRTALRRLGRETLERATQQMKDLDLRGVLELEARYVAEPASNDDEVLRGIPQDVVSAHIGDKIRRTVDQCVWLANVDRSKFDDDTVTPNQVFYVGLDRQYRGDEPGTLGRLTEAVAKGAKFLEGWQDVDKVVFYRALLGVPVYFFYRVATELYPQYTQVQGRPNRSYPLHIDTNWEDALPNLDPKEIREAEERRRIEDEAQRRRAARDAAIWSFTSSILLGNLIRDERGYAWSLDGVTKALAAKRSAAFDAFLALDAGVRNQLVESAKRAIEERTAERKLAERFAEDLRTHLATVKRLYLLAAGEDDREKQFLGEEQTVVERHLAEFDR